MTDTHTVDTARTWRRHVARLVTVTALGAVLAEFADGFDLESMTYYRVDRDEIVEVRVVGGSRLRSESGAARWEPVASRPVARAKGRGLAPTGPRLAGASEVGALRCRIHRAREIFGG